MTLSPMPSAARAARRLLAAAAAVAAAAALAACAVQRAPAGGGAAATVTLLHINDTHGRHLPFAVSPGNATAQTGDPGREPASFGRRGTVGGYPALAAAVDEARRRAGAGRVLLVHAGDTFSDDLLGNLTRGEATIRLLNAIGVDFLALGNHDFDYGAARTRELQAIAGFPMRAANVVDEAAGAPFLGDPAKVYTVSGVRVALLALGYHNTADTGSRDNVRGLAFGSGIEAARRLVPTLRERADVVVVVSHQGTRVDRELARAVPGIDVIIGGHSHDRVSPPEKVGGAWLVQALSDGAELGELTLKMAPGGGLASVEGAVRTLWTDELPADARVAALVDELRAPHRARLEERIAVAAERIGRQYRSESPFDTLVGDLLRERTGADLAMLPGVGYGVSLEPGPVTREALYTLLPHPSKLATVTLAGRQVVEVLEQSAANQRPADPMDRVGGLVQTAGMAWTADLRRPIGRRVSEVRVGGVPIEPGRDYRVATHAGMLQGVHRYRVFAQGRDAKVEGETLAEVVEAALRRMGTVRAPRTGAVTLIRAE